MAEILNTEFKATADFGQLISEANRAVAALSKLRNESSKGNMNIAADFAAANNQFRQAVTATGLFTASMVDVTSNTQRFGKSLDQGKLKLKDYFTTWRDYSRGTAGDIRKLAQEQVRMQQSVVQSLGRDMSGASKAMVITPTGIDAVANAGRIASQELSIYNKVLKDGATSLINWGKNTQWAGRQLTVGLTVPLTIFGKAAADAFKQADMELTRLTKVYGGAAGSSAEELASVRDNVSSLAKELAQNYGAAYRDTLALSADIAATGAEGEALLGSIAETTRLATLGEIDRQEAMKATLALQTAFNMNTTELAESINFLNAVENQTSTTLSDLVEAIPKAGPVIRGLGGDIEDLALLITAMKEGGIGAAEGANALKSGLGSLINPSKAASQYMAGFGISLQGIVDSNAGDLMGTIMDFKKALDTLDPLAKQKAIESIFGKYQFARIGALFDNIGEQGSQTLQVMDLMKLSATDLGSIADRELKLLTESASGKYRRALETFKASIAEIGEPFLKVAAGLLDVGSKLINIFNSLPKPIKAFAAGLGVITAVIGPMIMLAGVFANFLGYVVKGIAMLTKFGNKAEAFKLVTTASVAADQVADAYTSSLYNQEQAASILRAELERLAMAYRDIASAASMPPPSLPGGGVRGPGGPAPTVPTGPGAAMSGLQFFDPAAEERAAKADKLIRDISTSDAMTTSADRLDAMLAGKNEAEQMDIIDRETRKIEKQRLQRSWSGGSNLATQQGVYVAAAEKLGMRRGLFDVESPYDPTQTQDVTRTTSGHAYAGMKARMGKVSERLGWRTKGTKRNPEGLPFDVNDTQGTQLDTPEEQARNQDPSRRNNQVRVRTLRGAKLGLLSAMAEEEIRVAKPKGMTRSVIGDTVSSSIKDIGTGSRKVDPTVMVPAAAAPVATPSTKRTAVQVYNDPDTDQATKKSIDRNRKKQGLAPLGGVVNTRGLEKGMRSSSKYAALFSNKMMASVGTIGMITSMLNSMTGVQNSLINNAANFAMTLGYGLPAIKSMGAGLKQGVGLMAKQGGLMGKVGKGVQGVGRGLMAMGLTGPWGMAAIAGVVAIGFAIKYMNQKHQEYLRKTKADINVSDEALKKFGGTALDATKPFEKFVKDAQALGERLGSAKSGKKDLLGLPTREELDAISKDVDKLFEDQIKRFKDVKSGTEANALAQNLKATLVAQGVDTKDADKIIMSILEKAGKTQYSVPVFMEIQGITNQADALDRLKRDASKSFKDIQDSLKLDTGYIDEAATGRVLVQMDNLAAAAIASVKDFKDLGGVMNMLPENMKNLSFEQLNATVNGKAFLTEMEKSNKALYDAFKQAGSLGTAVQFAAANAMGLTTALSGVAGQLDIVSQQAQGQLTDQFMASSGVEKYYNAAIKRENAAIAKIRERIAGLDKYTENQIKAIEKRIDAENKAYEALQKQTDERKRQLKLQQESENFALTLSGKEQEKQFALLTGNRQEAAMIGIDIEKMLQDRSVDLAENALDEKAKADEEAHKKKLELLDAEKDKIKELGDAEKERIAATLNKQIQAHEKVIENLRTQMATKLLEVKKLMMDALSGGDIGKEAWDKLQGIFKDMGGDMSVLKTGVGSFISSMTKDFMKFFSDSLQMMLGTKYTVDQQTGDIYATKKDKSGKAMRDKSGALIADKSGGARGNIGDIGLLIAGGNPTGSKAFYSVPSAAKFSSDWGGTRAYMTFRDAQGITKTDSILDLPGGATLDEDAKEKYDKYIADGYTFVGYGNKGQYANGGHAKKSYMSMGARKFAYNGAAMQKAYYKDANAQAYLVGEKGPELFIPDMNGNVVSNRRLVQAVRDMNVSGGTGSNYNIVVNVTNPGASADQIANTIASRMKLEQMRVGESRYA